MPKKFSKIEVAVCQLETAIKLFFEGRDYLSAYTLAAAADGILQDLSDKNRGQALHRQKQAKKPLKFSTREELEMLLKPEFQKEAFRFLRRPQNFLKHANKDPDSVLEFDGPKQAYAKILGAVHNHDFLYGEITRAMQIFLYWMLAENPKLLSTDGPDVEVLMKGIEAARKIPSEMRLQLFFDVLRESCPNLFVTR